MFLFFVIDQLFAFIFWKFFRLEIMETSFWDQIDTEGTHLGMVGILQRSEADLGSTPAVMSRERATLIQLIGPVWPFRYT